MAKLRISAPGHEEQIIVLGPGMGVRIDESAKVTAEPMKPITLPHLDLDYLK